MKPIIIVSIWNPKGGQGKSMIALNLAAAAIEIGIKPLIIDQDPQGTAMKYLKGGNINFDVVGKIPKEKPEVDIVFIDHLASDWEVPDANMLIMPLKPQRDQFATYIDAYQRAKDKNKKIYTVVTNGQDQRKSERTIQAALKEKGAFVIPSSGVFSRAAEEYRTIYDEALDTAYNVRERRREISEILGKILLERTEKNSQVIGV